MSDAKVLFHSADHQPAKASNGVRFSFQCPLYDRRCGNLLIAGRTGLKRDGQNKNGGVAQWDFDGNAKRPTFKPSINCQGCWHGYIRNGRCRNTNGLDEPERNVT